MLDLRHLAFSFCGLQAAPAHTTTTGAPRVRPSFLHMKTIMTSLLLLCATAAHAQGLVKGKILDRQTNTPLEFVNMRLTTTTDTLTLVQGDITDATGQFNMVDLKPGTYILTANLMGYRNVRRQVTISDNNRTASFLLYMREDTHTLGEVTVKGMRSAMKLEVDRKSFDVSQLITNAGDAASDVLENIPSVEVDNDGNISLRGDASVEVWINGKASGLTADNRAQILQQLPAESIERIEVIDNPSAKFSAEGGSGIINIVLKKDLKPGYYGSVQVGGNTQGGANTSFNINMNSRRIDAYANIGYRHHTGKGHSESYQQYLNSNTYQQYKADDSRMGNNLFSRAGITLHATKKDDISLSGMLMHGGDNNWSSTPYHYGTIGAQADTRLMTRNTKGDGNMNMYYGEFNYRHNFTDKHFLDFVVSFDKWKSDNENIYQDSTSWADTSIPTDYEWQSRPMHLNNRTWEVKLDYENPISEQVKLQAGYQGNFSHENTPQESYMDPASWDGNNATMDEAYYNRFIYDMDLHAAYATTTMKFGKLGVMAGLRGEYWKVNTESYTWAQENDASLRDKPFKKDYFQLFPSVFLSYQLTENDQFQLNYTRRLRRPWGGQLNSFRDTRDATMVSFGNPELTPAFSNSFSFNYLRTWTEHSLMVSAYYRPTTDIIQRISWQSSSDGMMYSSNFNVAKDQRAGLELTLKDRFFRILDLTTNANAYYYKIDGFSYDIDGQTVTGDGDHNFTWSARMIAQVQLPYDLSVQASGDYRSRQSTAQGYRKSNYSVDLGVRKNFLNKQLQVSLNCRDLLDSRKFRTFSSSDTFTREQLNRRGSRRVQLTVTWNFGNNYAKRKPGRNHQGQMDDDAGSMGGYNGGGEE